MNESSTEDEMKKAYGNLERQFHPDKNKHSQASDVVLIINESKEELEDTLRNNSTIREQECVCMAQKHIESLSDSLSSLSSDKSLET